MKLILGLVLIGILGSFSINERTKNVQAQGSCECELTESVDQYLTENMLTTSDTIKLKELSDLDIKEIAAKLCVNVKLASAGGFKSDKFKSIILDKLSISPSTSESDKNDIVSNFLNQNKQKLVCPKNKDKGNDRDRHVYKTAILSGVIDLYDEILLDDDLYNIDFNAYEMVDGKKETVVDYIEKLIATGRRDNDDLEMLRDDIIDLGGKRGAEL